MGNTSDIVASVQGCAVELIQLKNGAWRAYILTERSPRNPRYCSYDKEVVRDNYGYIISGATKAALITHLKIEYPHWKYHDIVGG